MIYQLSYEASLEAGEGFIAQSVEHRTGVAEVIRVRIPLEPQNFYWTLFVTA